MVAEEMERSSCHNCSSQTNFRNICTGLAKSRHKSGLRTDLHSHLESAAVGAGEVRLEACQVVAEAKAVLVEAVVVVMVEAQEEEVMVVVVDSAA